MKLARAAADEHNSSLKNPNLVVYVNPRAQVYFIAAKARIPLHGMQYVTVEVVLELQHREKARCPTSLGWSGIARHAAFEDHSRAPFIAPMFTKICTRSL